MFSTQFRQKFNTGLQPGAAESNLQRAVEIAGNHCSGMWGEVREITVEL